MTPKILFEAATARAIGGSVRCGGRLPEQNHARLEIGNPLFVWSRSTSSMPSRGSTALVIINVPLPSISRANPGYMNNGFITHADIVLA
jgi:hypothetical protein